MTLYPGDLYNRLKADNAADWAAYVGHPFVAGMADGSLSDAAFRHYLVQDYKFLIHFSRAYALAAYKADTLEDIRAASETLAALIAVEMEMHVKYCAGWGLDPAAMEAAPEDNACMAYTRYVLETGLRGDTLDLHVALIPCVAGYGEIGARAIPTTPGSRCIRAPSIRRSPWPPSPSSTGCRPPAAATPATTVYARPLPRPAGWRPTSGRWGSTRRLKAQRRPAPGLVDLEYIP